MVFWERMETFGIESNGCNQAEKGEKSEKTEWRSLENNPLEQKSRRGSLVLQNRVREPKHKPLLKPRSEIKPRSIAAQVFLERQTNDSTLSQSPNMRTVHGAHFEK